MDSHDRGRDTQASRVAVLYDRLAGILKRLPPIRQQAFWTCHAAEQAKETGAANNEPSHQSRSP